MKKRNSIQSLKVYVFFILVGVGILVVFPSLVCGAELSQTYYFQRPTLEKTAIDGQVYDRVIMPDALNDIGDDLIGHPALPTTGAYILLPNGSEVESVEAVAGERIVLGDGYIIEPVQFPVVLSSSPASIQAVFPDKTVYSKNDNLPKVRAEYVETQSFRGYEYAIIKLHPVEYNPVTGELAYYSQLTITVKTKDEQKQSSLYRGLTKDAVEIENKVDNAESIDTYASAQKSGADNYDLLIITTSEYANAFEPLRSYHNSTGIQTEIHTIDEIGSNDPSVVRDFIRQCYLNDGIEYVLIGGDDGIIPARDLYGSFQSSGGLEEDETIPGDLYFGCLDGTFDYNGNGIYGEYGDGDNGESVDLVAEVYVGRASVESVEEAQRFVSKTLRYLTRQDTYLKKVLLVGEYLGFGGVSDFAGNTMDQLADSSDADGYETIGIPSSRFSINRLYDRDWSGNGWPNEELFERINNSVHVIDHLGHCNSSWALKSSSSTAVEKMKNNDLFFLYSQGCMPGAFDWGDCWAENVNIKTDYGAFAIIMNARFGLGASNSTDGCSQRYNREFWDAIYNPAENKPELARANSDSKEDNLYMAAGGGMRWVYYELNLFGDPTIQLWNKWLGLESYHFSDVQGDNDSVYEAGETIELTCSIEDVGIANAENVTMTLSLNDVSLELVNNTSNIGDISDGQIVSNASEPFVFSIPSDYVTRVDTFFVEVNWTESGQNKSSTLSFTHPVGRVPILVIDGNENDDAERYYLDYLKNANIPYTQWTTPLQMEPQASELMKYDIVVWFTGDYHANPIVPDDITAMRAFLDNGGKLFLTGQGIASTIAIIDNDFLNDYLKSDYSATKLSPLLTGEPGGLVFSLADSLSIQGGGGADNQTFPDCILPINGGVGELKWLGRTDFGGVSYSGNYKLVFLSFGFEAVLADDSRWAKRDSLFARILNFFDLEHAPNSPEIASLGISPNNVTHLMNHTPEIKWTYSDPNNLSQTFYQVQVGADYYWSPDNMWDSGPIPGEDSSVVYNGLPLEDGESYCVRVRAQNGDLWSDWEHIVIHLNSIPVPTGLTPANGETVYLGHIRLQHDDVSDKEHDPVTYSYELYDDASMTSLVEQADGIIPGGDKTTWQFASNLTVGEDYFWRVRANDGYEYGQWSPLASFIVGPPYLCGDANGDDAVNVGDAVHIINFVFKSGASPEPVQAGDSNCDGTCNVGDAVYLINYVFKNGSAPCQGCPD